jgi:hypothetical protein
VTPTQRLLIAAFVAVGSAGGFALGRVLFRPVTRVNQPIVFNHQIHAGELEIPCDLCHEYYATSEHSGLPLLTTCMDCHEEPLTESVEEQKIRDLAEDGDVDVFRKLFELPDHAFYSHRRHAELGQIPCETCHGDVATTDVPPERPLVRVSMDFCVDCHDREQVRSECTTCHR